MVSYARKTKMGSMTGDADAVLTVAGLMALSARTAPKAKGIDEIVTRIVEGGELGRLGNEMAIIGERESYGFFIRDGKCVKAADACVLVGVRGNRTAGVNCTGCGYGNCEAFSSFVRDRPKKGLYQGPNCIVRVTDLGVAVGSAVRTAAMHNVDNRVMYSAGVAGLAIGLLPECTVAYGIPLKAGGKNIFFDR